ncbi:MAG TPA: YkvA family protein [Phycisphaerales bacterium]|nr:YkvA family protein [Phycisphaerales bacterium]
MQEPHPVTATRRTRDPKRGPLNIPHGIWVLICLIYIISPFDFIPDFLPIIGWTDDTGMLGFAIYNVVQWMRARRRPAIDTPPSPSSN